MANAKTHITKKSLRKASGATDRAEQNLALAHKEEEEAIARMIKDFRRQARKKTSPATRVL
jgi:hypothetical protein